tara:strand:- start:57 stop:572 length:516 start_codon:yes stop_codon:yes gene_type:complete
MNKLKRITSEYIVAEDRIRIAALTEANKTLILWFTMRMMRHVITHCLTLLSKRSPEIRKPSLEDERSHDAIQSLVQRSAQQELPPEKAVSTNESSPNYLIEEVDLTHNAKGLIMILKKEGTASSKIFLTNQQLRQWLAMIYTLWQKADWPMTLWPEWISATETITNEISIH